MSELESLFAGRVWDGMTVGVGGLGLSRKPMWLVRALVATGVRELTLVSYLGSLDVELAIAAGAVAELHTAGVDLAGFGLAPAYRRARETETMRFVEWSEGSLVAALEAAGRGLGSMPAPTAPQSDVVGHNDRLVVAADPVTAEPTVFAAALPLDLALLHVPVVDDAGHLHVDGDVGVDALLAQAARATVATAEQVESRPPAAAALGRLWVDAVTVMPGGSWPTACHPVALADLAAVSRWAGSPGDDPAILEPRL